MRSLLSRLTMLVSVIVAAVLATRSTRPRPPAAQVAPDAGAESAVARALDELARSAWKKANLSLAPAAADRAVMRRLSLALIGRIPSLEEIRWFDAQPSGTALARWTDRLLSRRAFADYFAERWARSLVPSLPAQAFFTYRRNRFVSWLGDQFADGAPFDEIVRQLITAEGLWTDQPAVNFVTSHECDPVRLAGRTSRALLGLRLDCAECHDHPFAPWKQKDFQSLSAYYADASISFFGLKDSPRPYQVDGMMGKSKTIVEERPPFLPELDLNAGRRRQRLANWIVAPENVRFSKAIVHRLWTLLFSRPLGESVDDLDKPMRLSDVLDRLARDFRENGHDVRRTIRTITQTAMFRASSGFDGAASEEQERWFAAFPPSRLRPEQLASSLVQASYLQTLDERDHWLFRFGNWMDERKFIESHGDREEEELEPASGNLPQRLLLMNGEVIRDRVTPNMFSSAGRLADLAGSDEECVEAAYLSTLTRLPDREERDAFTQTLHDKKGEERKAAVSDLLWSLVNSTEFSWNH